jgi:oxygen-independent coproporphyrinogen-3 oxidase
MPDIEILATRVPRYTSYPTAPHFHSGVDSRTFGGWLAELPPCDLSLYVHIPFCDSLCWFCGCNTRAVNNYAAVSHYLDLLLEEIDRVAGVASFGKRVTHIHWGGGSPTILSPDDVADLAAHLFSRLEVARDAEFAVEIDPRGFTATDARALAEAGVNRASIGVQDCDVHVQRAINRFQPLAVTRTCVEALREAGIGAINIDLVYGLPHQTCTRLEKTVSAILSLNPDRVAVFGYAHVPDFKKHQRLIDGAALPGVNERLAQARLAHELLTGAGYVAIGLDHYAKSSDALAVAYLEKRLNRNFQGYTNDSASALLGFGASAISSLPNGYAQNSASVRDYRRALETCDFPTARGISLTREDKARRAIIESLMCYLSADLEEICACYDLQPKHFLPELEELRSLAGQGIVQIDRYTISATIRIAVRVVCAVFDAYIRVAPNRHAVAV